MEKGKETWIEFTWSGRLLRLDCQIRSCRRLRGDDQYRTGLMISGGFSNLEYRKRVDAAMAKMRAAETKRTPVI